MTKSESHKRAQRKAAGKAGATEAALSGDRRLDAITASKGRATEVERSGRSEALEKAVRRLAASGAGQRVLQVPNDDMDAAADAMRKAGVPGTVKNLSGTRRRSVRKK